MFPFSTTRTINWFPGHMAKATRQMKEQLRRCDLVVELRDARIPITSGNPLLDEVIGNTPRLVILNKMDLADPGARINVEHFLRNREHDFLFSNLASHSVGRRSLQAIMSWAHCHSKTKFKTTGSLIMVVGMPNVGKSTLINLLRGRNVKERQTRDKQVAKVGPKPGVTRQMTTYKVSEDPLMYLMDTPGVMVPRIRDAEAGLKLALTGAIKDEVVGLDLLAEYLLHCLQHRRSYPRVREKVDDDDGLRPLYIEQMGLKMVPEDVEELLSCVLRRQTNQQGKKSYQQQQRAYMSHEMACHHLLRLFREGALGPMTLDDIV